MANFPHHQNIWEYIVSMAFSVLSLAWAHFTNTDGLFFKLVIAPSVAAAIGFATVRVLKRFFPDNK